MQERKEHDQDVYDPGRGTLPVRIVRRTNSARFSSKHPPKQIVHFRTHYIMTKQVSSYVNLRQAAHFSSLCAAPLQFALHVIKQCVSVQEQHVIVLELV